MLLVGWELWCSWEFSEFSAGMRIVTASVHPNMVSTTRNSPKKQTKTHTLLDAYFIRIIDLVSLLLAIGVNQRSHEDNHGSTPHLKDACSHLGHSNANNDISHLIIFHVHGPACSVASTSGG